MKSTLIISVLMVAIFPLFTTASSIDSLILELKKLPDDTSKVNLLYTIGNEFRDSSVEKSMYYLDQSIGLAEKLNYTRGLAYAYLYKGRVFNYIGDRYKALDEFNVILKILQNSDEDQIIAMLKYEIGNIYIFWEKHHIAIDHFLDALEYYENQNDINHTISLYLNVGNAFRGIEDEEKALKYYQLAKKNAEKIKDTTSIVYALNNIGNVYSDLGHDEKALEYYQLTLETNKNIGDNQGQSAALSNIGSIHIRLGNYKKALEYLNKAQRIALENNFIEFIIENYMTSSQAYEKMGIYKRSLELYKDYSNIKDSVYNAEKQRQINELQAKYDSEKKDKEIELLENKEKINRFWLYAAGSALLFSVFIGVLIYGRQKNKIRKDRELMEKNKLIHEAQKKLVEVEKKDKVRLQEELKNKNNELTNFALHIIHKNELIYEIKSALRELKGKEGTEKTKLYNELLLKLNQNLKTNKELQEFQMHVEKVNHDYFYQLKQKFPDLTENEKRLSALLRLNLSSKEIASLNNISVKAVEMGRYRLRKKLDLGKSANLSRFLQEL